MKITWFTAILTSGFISLTMVTTVHLLRSKNIQRSVICGLLKVSRKGFEVLFLLASSSNLPLGHSEGQKWSGQPSLSWCNFSRWPPHSQNLDIAVSFSHVVRSGNLGEYEQSFEFSIFLILSGKSWKISVRLLLNGSPQASCSSALSSNFCHAWNDGSCQWSFGQCHYHHCCEKCEGDHPHVNCGGSFSGVQVTYPACPLGNPYSE